jgi:hypothetical protein
MKKLIIKTVLITILLTTLNPVSCIFAQNGDPPPPPGEHGSTQNHPPGGGAPVGSGVVLLLTLGAAYGGKKVCDLRKSCPSV